VLVVLAQPPVLEGGAAGRTAVALLRGLQRSGLPVRAVAAHRAWDPPGQVPDDLDVEVVPADLHSGFAARQAHRLSRPGGDLSRGPFGARVRALARDADVLHLEEVGTAWCSAGTRRPAVTHLHYAVRRDRDLGRPWSPGFREVAEAVAAERAALRRSDVVVASSPVVAADLRRRAPRADVVVAPLALDPEHYPTAALDGPPTAGLLGTGSWPPTRDALRRLLDDVWPRVRARVPDARLLVAGRGMAAAVGPAPGEGVVVVGEVASAAQFLAGLSLLLYPLERGSGMKVKVLEALACGVPVVTTASGAEGVPAGGGVHVVAGPQQQADAAVALLRDPDRRREAGRAARRLFLERFTPGAAVLPLLPVYARLASTRR
jgi:glycosyltransferase involved in cell wall biosynthesis